MKVFFGLEETENGETKVVPYCTSAVEMRLHPLPMICTLHLTCHLFGFPAVMNTHHHRKKIPKAKFKQVNTTGVFQSLLLALLAFVCFAGPGP